MATTTRPWTRAELEHLPDDNNRYEVLDGQLLVTPLASVAHQNAASALTARIRAHCDEHRIGTTFAPGAIAFGQDELQPDVMVVPGTTSPLPSKWEDLPLPILVVEILSPSTRLRDLGVKRAAYERFEIREYWIVDVDARAVTVVRREQADRRETQETEWRAGPLVPPLVIRLRDVFR